MAVNVKMTINRVPAVAAAIAKLATTRVMVGIPADKTSRKDDDGGPINNATLMAIHENGAPEANIPARPVVHPTISENQSEIVKGLRKVGETAMNGSISGVDKQYHSLGIMVQNKMRAKITSGPFVPLSERTLAKRRAEGHKSTKPLIATGQLRRALTYVIRAVTGDVRKLKGK